MATISRLSVLLTANTSRFQKGMRSAGRSVRDFAGVAAGLGAVFGVAGGALGIGVLGNNLVEVNEKFQNLKSSLKTVTGGAEEAAAAFSQIEDFALSTPFALEEVVRSFIKLKALGLDPSERALRSYGNTASAMGKSLNQMIEAVADASVGEFERLKEFGIKARSQGDQVSFTFQGITTTVKKNAEEIQGYLLGIGENQFGGAMADQMNNLTPAFSNFRAAVEGLQVAFGEAGFNQILADLVNGTTAWIQSFDKGEIKEFFDETRNAFAEFNNFFDEFLRGLLRYELGSGLPGAGDILGGSSNYQLGDFNRANPTSFDDWSRAIRNQGDDQVDEQKRSNELLQQIVDQNSGAAVAG